MPATPKNPPRVKRGQRHALGSRSVVVGTWCDAPGENHVFPRQSKATGLRVVVQVWHSDGVTRYADGSTLQHREGDATVRLIKGDGWRPRTKADLFREFAREEIPAATTEQIRDAVDRLMALEV